MVVIIMLLRNGPLVLDNLSIFGCDLPKFVSHCTRLDGFHTLYGKREICLASSSHKIDNL